MNKILFLINQIAYETKKTAKYRGFQFWANA
jgi:hypothetical protein